jgi:hypothetical protein
MEKEIWKDIPNYENYYQASNFGKIRSKDRIIASSYGSTQYRNGRILKCKPSSDGYVRVVLSVEGVHSYYTVHKLIAVTFLSMDYNQNGMDVDHVNGNKSDNRVSNLEVVTRRENTSRGFKRKGTKSGETGVWAARGKWSANIRRNGERINIGVFDSKEEAIKYYNMAVSSVEKGLPILTKKPSYSSRYIGVGWHKASSSWSARVTVDGIRYNIGIFDTEKEAAMAIERFNGNQ